MTCFVCFKVHKGDRILTNDKLDIIGVIDWSKVVAKTIRVRRTLGSQ
jgi:hypothetical protein